MTSPQSLFWYNKELCGKAGVDPTKIKYWEDSPDAVKKCKAAGVTPIIVVGADERPLHFYPMLLMCESLASMRWLLLTKVTKGDLAALKW